MANLTGTSGNDNLYGDASDDRIRTGGGTDVVNGGSGNDWVNCTVNADGSMSLYLYAGSAKIYGITGNDYLVGTSGNDTVQGGLGDDYINGLAGDDKLYGEEGFDFILTGDGFDYVDGGSGDDRINGYLTDPKTPAGAYTAWVNAGSKKVFGLEGDDFIYGGSDADNLYGGVGHDVIYGDAGNDVIMGEDGNDYLNGGAGNDSLYGAAGNDTLAGGTGFDLLWGGDGNDTYKISSRDFYLYDTAGNDTAVVSTSFVKIPASIETVTYTNGAQALPYWLDDLLAGNAARFATLLGVAKAMNFAFPATLPSYDTSAAHALGYLPFNMQQQVFARLALGYISSVVDIGFIESNTAAAANTLTFANNTQVGSAGYAGYPTETPSGSDLFLNCDTPGNLTPVDGGYAALTLIHELGHALGLKHPFDHPDARGEVGEGPFLPAAEDNTTWSVMSYTSNKAQYHLAYSPLDIAALQYLYGPSKTARTGNDTYTLAASEANFVWDGAGTDTLSASGQTLPVTLYLEPGYRQQGRYHHGGRAGDGQFWHRA
jgi:Ca2+-binding RTX toxin-like protein